MAVIVFSGSDQQAEAMALISVLSGWLRQMPDQTPRAASAKFIYGSLGVSRLEVTLEPPVDEPK
jgi:hypothetical protein